MRTGRTIPYFVDLKILGRIHTGHQSHPLEIVYNKPHQSILLQIKEGTAWKGLILFLQEVKEISSKEERSLWTRRREELLPRQQAHLSVVNKICVLLEYQRVFNFTDALAFLQALYTHFFITNHIFHHPSNFLIIFHPVHLTDTIYSVAIIVPKISKNMHSTDC